MKKYVNGIIGLIFILSSILVAQPKSKPYDYPIKSDTQEWNALTLKQRIAVCQIPDSILSHMATPDLIETCLNYPFNGDLIAFNFLQDGFNHLKKQSNGWGELMRRKDLGSAVINKYTTMDTDSMKTKQYPGADFLVIETLLKQKEVINTLSKDDRNKLLKELYDKYTGKIKYPEKYAFFGYINNIALMGEILIIEDYIPFVEYISNRKELKNKIEVGFPFTEVESNLVLKNVHQYLQEIK
jgi:hypothetical protein